MVNKSYPRVQPVSGFRVLTVFCEFYGFLNSVYFLKPKPEYMLGHRVYRSDRESGSGVKTLVVTK